ncbi:MAG: alpha-mannosidase [Anaerolineae bacterium]|nr:alpha-mannosidase [Anaerolineae bacterium]
MNMMQLERMMQVNAMWREADWVQIRSQIRFAEHLAATDSERGGAWQASIAQAKDAVATALTAAPVDWPGLVAETESILAPLSEAAKARTLYLAGHAHIDMNWMWSWPETVSVTLDTFRTMLDLLETFPEFHFSQSQGSVYAIVEKHAPELLPRIAHFVQEGRWEVTASHWVESDKNMVSGEALCRHVLTTRAYMARLFDLVPEDVQIDWSPDTFGHAATVPTYLRQGEIRYLYMHRPGNDQQPVPEAFWWEGPDGSRVLVRNDQKRGYNGTIHPDTIIEVMAAMQRSVGLEFAMLVYGVGDHGGGPTRRDLLAAREMRTWPVFPTLVFSPTRTFYEALEKQGGDLPVLRGELNTEFAGCYTTQSLIKRANRLAEARLADAEFAAAADRLVTGAPYPTERLVEDWQRTLFSHFHDILPGSGVRDTRTYAHGLFQETAASTAVLTTRALRHVADAVDTAAVCGSVEASPDVPALFTPGGQGGGAGIRADEGHISLADRHGTFPSGGVDRRRPFVIFNPTPAERREVVRLTLWDREPPGTPVSFHNIAFEARDAEGERLAVQGIGKGAEWGHQNQTVAVPVTVPALGYTTVALRESMDPPPAKRGAWLTSHQHHCPYSLVERDAIGMENDLVSVAFDQKTGRIVSFRIKATGEERIDATPGGLGFEFSVERPHPMSAWLIDNSGVPEHPALVRVEASANGPYLAELVLTYTVRASTITARYALHVGDAALHIALEIDWFERGSPERGIPNLRLAVPTTLQDVTARYEIPFGALDRQTAPDKEVPALRWAKLSGKTGEGQAAVVLFNDCKHGHAVEGSTLRLNLVRSSYDPDYLPDVDKHLVRLALLATDATVSDATLSAKAGAHEKPLLVIGTGVHDGKLPATESLVRLSGEDVALSGLKWAESGEGLVIRLTNSTAAPAVAELTCAEVLGTVQSAQPLDLMERPVGETVAAQEGAISIIVPANGLGTWLVRLAHKHG